MNDPALEYIRANRNTYTREAITQVLLDAGHAPDAVAAAWQVVDEEDARSQSALQAQGIQGGGAAPPGQGRFPSSVVALLILIFIVGLLLVLLTDLMFALRGDSWIVVLLANVGSLIVFVGLVVAAGRLLKRQWPVGKVMATVLLAALVWYLIVAGICFNPIAYV
jgi:hypothetical protein